MKTFCRLISILLACFAQTLFAAEKNVVNVYMWSGVVPDAIIQQFEKETGIKVNFSTYDSNELMYAKLKTSKNLGYDVVEPTSYFVDRMRKQDMLEKLDKSRLSNFKNINPAFLNGTYDPKNVYSIPFTYGTTGIFTNTNYISPTAIKSWADLWDKKYLDQVLLLDDMREVFAVGLKTLGYSVNDNDPEHIKQAYLKLKELQPNIKLFSSSILSILIDEDVHLGMAWNGDLYKAKLENAQLHFTFPKEGFLIWIDSFAIPKNAPHQENAYKFLNFMLRADVARDIALDNKFATPNLAGQKLLPAEIRNNPIMYPSRAVLRRGEFQKDIESETLTLYEKYWERLKMGG